MRAAVVMALLACDGERGETGSPELSPAGGRAHPQAGFLPYAGQPRINLTLNDTTRVGDLLEVYRNDEAERPTVGADSSAPFGEVRKVIAVGEDLGVFDPYQAGVHIVTRQGVLSETVGRPGAGPGEFRRPTAVLSPHRDTLLIADVMRKLEIFARQQDSDVTWKPVRTEVLDFSIADLCRVGDRHFAYGYAIPGTGGPIRVLDHTFSVQRRFGEVYTSTNEGINSAFADYSMACDAEADLIVLVPRAGIGEMYFLRTTGEVKRILHWTDFHSFRIEEDVDDYSVIMGEGGVNRLRTLNLLGQGVLLAQYDWVSPEDMSAKEDYSVLFSIAIDTRNGRILGRTTNLPPLSIIDEQTFVSHINDPWPGIAIKAGGRSGSSR